MNLKKAMGSFIFFFIILFSYVPMSVSIDDIVANATLTNPVIEFMNTWFGIFWATIAILFLGMGIYYAVEG